jgi:SagB-type dehydrogenase family enzyme
LKSPALFQKKLGQLDRTLEIRQSRREFSAPLTMQQLSDLLWHSYRLRRKVSLQKNIFWESRPSPSGGGCYPIQILVIRTVAHLKSLLAYFPEHHAFGVCDLSSGTVFNGCLQDVERCLQTGNGTILWFVADLGLSGKRYHNPESLAWRDSGALLATVSLVAEGMGLNCCGLGLHDIPSLRKFLKLEDWTIGVGGCVLATR